MCVFTLCDLSDAVWRTRGDKLTNPTQCCSTGEQTHALMFDLEPVQVQSMFSFLFSEIIFRVVSLWSDLNKTLRKKNTKTINKHSLYYCIDCMESNLHTNDYFFSESHSQTHSQIESIEQIAN